MNPLISFTNDEATREAVFAYIQKTLDEYSLDLVYRGEDTKHMKGARDALTKAKSKMILEFRPKTEAKGKSRSV